MPCEFNNTAGFSALTIRSSRARFAASALAGYDLTIANAAQRPGLAQALERMEVFSILRDFAEAALRSRLERIVSRHGLRGLYGRAESIT